MKMIDLISDEDKAAYTDIRELPDGRLIATHRLISHWTLLIDLNQTGYEDRYCFKTYELVKAAFDNWQGEGDPEGWHRHPYSGRRRNILTGREWNDADPWSPENI